MEEIALRYTETFIIVYSAVIVNTWLMNLAAVLIDLWEGIRTAQSLGEPIESGKLRKTITKFGEYFRVQLFGLIVDIFGSLFFALPFTSIAIIIGIVAIECISVVENLKRKKSAAAQLPSVIADIIKAKNNGDALAIINQLKAEIKQEEEKEKKGE